jgi:CTP:molybdopterin cytidylyltransferase MocA
VAVAEGSLAVAVFDGLRRPPTKVGRRFWDELPVSGDSGARSLLAARAPDVLEVACRGNPADIDTVEDLQLWN